MKARHTPSPHLNDVLEIPTHDGRLLRVAFHHVAPLRGILVLLPAGLKYSVGPHRLNRKLASELASLGMASAFVDPGGYGDSEGHLPIGSTRDIWRSIESGALVDDILTATKTLRSRHPDVPFYVCGLCGGAVTAFLAAARAPELFDGVVSFSLAVIVTPVGTTAIPLHSPTFVSNLLGAYAQRALSIAAWRRIFSGEARITGPLRAALATIRHRFAPSSRESLPGLNMVLRDALHVLAAHRMPQLMIFGSSDRRHHEFMDASARGLWPNNKVPEFCYIETTPHANHEFHFQEWQSSAFETVRTWVTQQLTDLSDRRR